jgi:hypothetical protein
MSRQPLRRERICEVLESCRAGSGDLYCPEFADVAGHVAANPRLEKLYEQIQNADLKISAAFLDVEIPPGLEDRILTSLAPASPAAKKNHIFSRRRLLAMGGLLTAAAAIFLAVFFGMNKTAVYSEQTVLENAIQFFDAEDPAAQGHLLASTMPPGEFSFSKAVLPLQKTRWREIKNFMGRSGVAFDLPPQGGARATLYVLDLSVANLADTPDQKKLFTTAGCCTAAWRENGLVYVLVVQGGQQSYRNYLLRSHGPLA